VKPTREMIVNNRTSPGTALNVTVIVYKRQHWQFENNKYRVRCQQNTDNLTTDIAPCNVLASGTYHTLSSVGQVLFGQSPGQNTQGTGNASTGPVHRSFVPASSRHANFVPRISGGQVDRSYW